MRGHITSVVSLLTSHHRDCKTTIVDINTCVKKVAVLTELPVILNSHPQSGCVSVRIL